MNKKSIKLQTLFEVIFSVEILYMVLMFAFILNSMQLKEQLRTAEKQRYEMHFIADQLRQSSDDLTRFARTYVVTEKIEYRDNFYKILDIRNGVVARPQNYGSIYWDYSEPLRSILHPDGDTISLNELIRRQAYTKEELDRIEEAHKNSDALVALEEKAFNALEGLFSDVDGKYTIRREPNKELALNLVFSQEYHDKKEKIMKPIDEFTRMMTERTNSKIALMADKTEKNETVTIILLGVFIISNIIIFTLLHQRVIKIILEITRNIRDYKKRDNIIHNWDVKYDDELGMLVNELNSMQSVIKTRTDSLKQTNNILKIKEDMINRYIASFEVDLQGNIVDVSQAFCELSGYSDIELKGKNIRLLYTDTTLKYNSLLAAITNGNKWQGEVVNFKKNGNVLWTNSFIEAIKNKEGVIEGYRCINIDISDKKRAEKLSVTDQLTGLFNRMKLDEVFLYEIRQAKRYGVNFSVVLCDIDDFKCVNDQYSHLVGDHILKEFSGIFQGNIRDVDTIGRWGGEEFLVICPNISGQKAKEVGEKIRGIVEAYDFPEVGHLTASFGVTSYEPQDTVEEMLGRADKALYNAKGLGKNSVVLL